MANISMADLQTVIQHDDIDSLASNSHLVNRHDIQVQSWKARMSPCVMLYNQDGLLFTRLSNQNCSYLPCTTGGPTIHR